MTTWFRTLIFFLLLLSVVSLTLTAYRFGRNGWDPFKLGDQNTIAKGDGDLYAHCNYWLIGCPPDGCSADSNQVRVCAINKRPATIMLCDSMKDDQRGVPQPYGNCAVWMPPELTPYPAQNISIGSGSGQEITTGCACVKIGYYVDAGPPDSGGPQ